ncbi:MAG TPA: hypothetical protein VLA44_06985, partial [Clostridia bacterium]|nr:hypothetical protein [Clostridia bacterium]
MTAIELVPTRPLVLDGLEIQFPLAPGDRTFVQAGATVAVGDPIAERFRDTHLAEVRLPSTPAGEEPPDLRPGERWTLPAHRGGRATRRATEGELLYAWRGGWRVAAGDHGDPLDAPVAGIVRAVEPGVRVVVRCAGRALRGAVALGGPSRGRLRLAAGPAGELRAGGLDVALA